MRNFILSFTLTSLTVFVCLLFFLRSAPSLWDAEGYIFLGAIAVVVGLIAGLCAIVLLPLARSTRNERKPLVVMGILSLSILTVGFMVLFNRQLSAAWLQSLAYSLLIAILLTANSLYITQRHFRTMQLVLAALVAPVVLFMMLFAYRILALIDVSAGGAAFSNSFNWIPLEISMIAFVWTFCVWLMHRNFSVFPIE
ncbi:MAG: hypothetical protein JWM56_158 [Candidatus Peribacteria bacterium]|nr:hypothetical protein [Candidatus Peribacteria bacterium]